MKPYTIIRPKPVLVYPLDDKQAILDYVFHHFIVEGNPAGVDEAGTCLYNTPSGGCAIGCLLKGEIRESIKFQDFSLYDIFKGMLAVKNKFIFGELAKLRGTFSENFDSSFLESLQRWYYFWEDRLYRFLRAKRNREWNGRNREWNSKHLRCGDNIDYASGHLQIKF